MAMCAGVQNVSRPMVRCQEMSHRTPTTILVAPRTTVRQYQGTDLVGAPVVAGAEVGAMIVPVSMTIVSADAQRRVGAALSGRAPLPRCLRSGSICQSTGTKARKCSAEVGRDWEMIHGHTGSGGTETAMDLETLIGAARQQGASDLHLEAGLPPALRVRGSLRTSGEPVPARILSEWAHQLLGEGPWQQFLERRSADISRTLQ